MPIADLHCDLLYKMDSKPTEARDITLASLNSGDVRLQVFAAFCAARKTNEPPYEIAKRQLDLLDTLMRDWRMARIEEQNADISEKGCICAIPAIEGGEALEGSIERLEAFARRGVRIITLTWNNENELGYPAVSGDVRGLKPTGKRILRRMAELGVAADVSHLNDAGFWDVAEVGVPMLASHSNARALCAHPRNLTDTQLKAIAQSGGLVGINFYPVFLVDSGSADINDIIRHVLHIANIIGERYIAFGSDFDGIDKKTYGVEGPNAFPAVIEAMVKAGFADKNINDIAYDNTFNYFKRLLGY